MNYEIEIKIDETALDVEWLEQPALAIKYGINWAKKARALQQAEEDIKLIRAELSKKCFEEWEKPTVVAVEAYYRTHKRHKEAKERLLEAQYQLNIAEVAKNEISFTRKAALENLVRLHGQNYFAGPNMPRDLTNEVEARERQKKVDSGVASKMTRTKR